MSEKKLRIMSGILLVISVIIFGIFQYKEKVGKDQSGPVFSVESDTITISVKDDESALMSGITASDAKDGDLHLEFQVLCILKRVIITTHFLF